MRGGRGRDLVVGRFLNLSEEYLSKTSLTIDRDSLRTLVIGGGASDRRG